jgi:phytoene dehydrogenase-like protein
MHGRYDGILIGTGHNALILQAYLSRSGLKTLSIDRAATPGGGLETRENPRLPGFLHNTHSFFHRGVTSTPWYRDLELESQGARYVEPELNVALLLPDGRSLKWWTDPRRTIESIAEHSTRDARTVERWMDEFAPMVEKIILPEACSPPIPSERRVALLERTALGRRFLEVSAFSPLEFITREIENDVVRAGLLFFNGLREVDLRLPGFGHSIPSLLASRRMAQMCIGGSEQLARALVSDIELHGGEVRCGVEPRRILVRGGRAVGIELRDGERVFADGFVASGLNPSQTFLELLDPGDVPEEARRGAKAFRYNLIAPLFAVDLALEEPPRYDAARRDPDLDAAFMVILGLERFSQFAEIVAAHEAGKIAAPVAWGACPTLFDPSQAPPGKHTAFLWEKVPFRRRGDPASWRSASRTHGRRLLELWRRFAPNLTPATILDESHRSPLDTVERLPNMAEGDLLVGSFAGGQVGYDRPFRGAGEYRAALPGLYLCGGSTHPGGNITGLCGYNAASVVAADLEIDPWWSPRHVEDAWKML